MKQFPFNFSIFRLPVLLFGWIITGLFLFPATGNGQQLFFPGLNAPSELPLLTSDEDSDIRQRVMAGGHFHAFSDIVIQSVGNRILFNREIDNSLKNRLNDRLSDIHGFESDLDVHLIYSRKTENFPGLGSAEYFVSLSHRNHRFFRFPGQAMQLALYGNARFEDQTVVISPLQSAQHIYQQLSFGLKKPVEKGAWTLTPVLALSFLQGNAHWNLDLKSGSLYTAPDGEFLDLQYTGRLDIVNDGPLDMHKFSGAGMSADVGLMLRSQNGWEAGFFARDIGWITWWRDVDRYAGDSLIHFEGLEISNILQPQDSFLNQATIDSIFQSLMPETKHGRFGAVLPVSLKLAVYRTLLDNKLTIGAGAMYRNLPGSFPFFFVRGTYRIMPIFSAGATVLYGGYGALSPGIELRIHTPQFQVLLGSNALHGLILPEKATSGGLFLGLEYRF